MSYGVHGLRAGDIGRSYSKPIIEGSKLKEGTAGKMRKSGFMLLGVNGLHAGDVDQEREANH